jgi:hypothetical protein
MVAALVRGDDEFLGRQILQHPRRTLILTSDSGGDREYATGLAQHLTEEQLGRCLIQDWNGTALLQASLEELQATVARQHIQLVVLDNLQMAMCPGESVNDDAAVRRYTGLLSRLNQAGAACLLVHHSSEKPSLNGVEAITPMGASVLISSSRAHIRLRGPNGKRAATEARVVSNDAPESVLAYSTDWTGGAPALAVAQPEQRQPRIRAELVHNQRAKHLLKAPPEARADASKLGRWWTDNPSPDGHQPRNPGAGRTAVRKLINLDLLHDAGSGHLTAGPAL